MSLYDELIVDYPLPDGFDPEGHVFQTQDTPEQYLQRYVLNAHGVLQVEATGEVIPVHGDVTFYTGNGVGYAPWGVKTRDDQPEWEAEYTALFDHGHLLKIEGRRQLCVSTRPHILRADFDAAGQRWQAAHPRPPAQPWPFVFTQAQSEALRPVIERLLAYYRTNSILDDTVNDCCGRFAEIWDQLPPWMREKETP